MQSSTCPYCAHVNPELDARRDGIVDCESCDRSFAAFGHGLENLTTPQPLKENVSRDSNTLDDVPLIRSGVIALLSTAALYAALETPLGSTYLGQLLSARGWVPYVIVFFALWALVILAFKFRRHRDRLGVLTLELLPRTLGNQIDARNAEAFRSYLRELAAVKTANPLIARLDWAMRRIASHSEPKDLAAQLADRSRLDADVLDSSYGMLRVLVWAIPILGFIGTVLGISEAVSGFSTSVDSAASLEVMRASIGTVTTGLGVAFDTTLLALVMSILIMFPMSSLQKAEEDFLARCDEYCDLHLQSRLARAHPEPQSQALGDTSLRSLIERLEARIERLEPKRSER